MTHVLQLDNDTFVADRLAFRVEHEYINAWGWHCLSGRLFDMATMTLQRDAIAACNLPDTRLNIVTAAFRKALNR